jgi:hypothetical protein
MDMTDFLRDVAKDLARSGITSRNLAALVFDAEGMDIEVQTCATEHGFSYPPLAILLDTIGRSCAADHITVDQLRRLTFFEKEVRLEYVDGRGRPASHIHRIAVPLGGM